ncbi:MAG: AAA family ATPase [Gemmatimonadetes bacterium]|nr:AAA family ATPase [Gemmatimonadota bacterium]MYC91441.1 AAA family ATPase [Gemmatimonadota bacterium]
MSEARPWLQWHGQVHEHEVSRAGAVNAASSRRWARIRCGQSVRNMGEQVTTNLSIRVPWHDSQWNGTVCRDPAANCHCVDYKNILQRKSVSRELRVRGKPFASFLPPCAKESGGFLSPEDWYVEHQHPYTGIERVAETHGHLKKTIRRVPRYTALGVPFRWLRQENRESWVAPRVLRMLPPEEDPPQGFKTAWVFNPALQAAILDAFYEPVEKDTSLALFYTKGAHPLGDDISRLVVGVGSIERIGQVAFYDSTQGSVSAHPIWEREIAHSLRAGGEGGLLVPFSDYLTPTGDEDEDARRADLAKRLVIEPDQDRIAEFSYRTEHITPDATIGVLTRAIKVAHYLREDGIARGSWAAAETWLNERLSATWRLRGPNPGVGAVLEAMGLRMGVSLVQLAASRDPQFAADPWAAVSQVLDGVTPPPHDRFQADIAAFASQWVYYKGQPERMELARCLSRLAITVEQARRWWEESLRSKTAGNGVSDREIIDNPYVVAELDRGSRDSRPVSFATVDLGALNSGRQVSVLSPADRRRLRAALVATLRRAETQGDTLLGVPEARDRVAKIPVADPVVVPDGWTRAEVDFLSERVVATDGDPQWLQLTERRDVADRLQRKLRARTNKKLPSLGEQWNDILVETVKDTLAQGDRFDPNDPRTSAALNEQADALERLTTRKASVLVGRAGTGKTTVLGALSRGTSQQGRVLFLAPTGKARVRLESRVAEGTDVMTVAKFLHSQGRYDGSRQEPIIGGPCYDGHEAVVVDEASMLTEDTLAAVIGTFGAGVKRLILVGDPAQLPPIGAGRPFADLVAHLDPADVSEDEDLDDREIRRGALARLKHEVRAVQGQQSDTLRLARWFTGDELSPDAESIFVDMVERKAQLTDLDIRFWSDARSLQEGIAGALRDHLQIADQDDLEAFNRSFLMEPYKRGWVPNDPAGAEQWQVLSPVRRDVWGCDDLNKWIQSTWRLRKLEQARRSNSAAGPQEIIKHDKVILLENGEREGWDSERQEKISGYLANGEVALVRTVRRNWRNLLFAGRPAKHTYNFHGRHFGDGESRRTVVELAYALTVHKAQGSEFGVVIVVLPRHPMVYRELVYTALTRSRRQLVLMVQGDGVGDLIDLSKPTASVTSKRNTNLFRLAVREGEDRPYARHLVHRAPDGELLRSKSELLIYTRCLDAGLHPQYECRFEPTPGDWKWPDFTFIDDAGDAIIWEHLGMMGDPQYASEWDKKREWYLNHGFVEGESLFSTEERGGLDVADVDAVIAELRRLVS